VGVKEEVKGVNQQLQFVVQMMVAQLAKQGIPVPAAPPPAIAETVFVHTPDSTKDSIRDST
jgi:hypothetical protein